LRAAIHALTEHQLSHAQETQAMPRERALGEFVRQQLRPLSARDDVTVIGFGMRVDEIIRTEFVEHGGIAREHRPVSPILQTLDFVDCCRRSRGRGWSSRLRRISP
jgi:hypothetical protein